MPPFRRVSGIDFPDDGRCVVLTDWDRDGDQDLWISNRNAPRLRFMKNNAPAQHHYVSLGLVGNGTSTNRDAIGAQRRSHPEGRCPRRDTGLAGGLPAEGADPPDTVADAAQTRDRGTPYRLSQTLRAGEGFMSQSSKWLHFGLGQADGIDRVIVRWPGGPTQEFVGLEVNRRYRLRQDHEAAEVIDATGPAVELAAGEASLPAETRTARVALASRVAMPGVVYTQPSGAVVTEEFTAGAPTLVNLWASWCLPCMQELTEFAAQQQPLADAGLRIISLSVDQLAERPGSAEHASEADVADVVGRIGYAFPWGLLDAAQMTLLQELHDQFFFLKRPLPLPSGFLVDADGRLAVIYTGPVSVAQLLEDVQRSVRGYQPSPADAACFPGRTLDHPRVAEVAERTDLQTRYHVAAWLEEAGRYRDALRNFSELVELDPNWSLPYRHLAKLHLKQNELTTAYSLRDTRGQLDPDSASAHNTLGLIQSQQGEAVVGRGSIADRHPAGSSVCRSPQQSGQHPGRSG